MSLANLLRRSPRALTVSLAAAALSMLSSGTHYAFSLFGPRLADLQGYSASQTTTLATCWNYGIALVGPPAGALVERTSPRRMSLLAALSLLSGYLVLAQLALPSVTPWPFWIACASFVLLGMGNTFAYMSALSTTAYNFPPAYRGSVMGLAIACFGLAGFAVTLIDRIWFAHGVDGQPDTHGLLVTLALLIASINLFSAEFLKRMDEVELVSPRYDLIDEATSPSSSLSIDDSESSGELVSHLSRSVVDASKPFARSLDTYLVASVLLCVCGAGLMYINNIGTICQALLSADGRRDVSDAEVQLSRNAHVARFSIASASGRLIAGYISDRFLPRDIPRLGLDRWKAGPGFWARLFPRQVARLPFAGVAASSVALGLLLCAQVIADDASLQQATLLIGLGYGAMFTLVPTMVSEWWGAQGFAWRWGWFTLAPSIGAQLLNSIFGLAYDRLVEDDGSRRCWKGRECYSGAVYVAALLCCSGIVAMSVLWWRKRRATADSAPTLPSSLVRESIDD